MAAEALYNDGILVCIYFGTHSHEHTHTGGKRACTENLYIYIYAPCFHIHMRYIRSVHSMGVFFCSHEGLRIQVLRAKDTLSTMATCNEMTKIKYEHIYIHTRTYIQMLVCREDGYLFKLFHLISLYSSRTKFKSY